MKKQIKKTVTEHLEEVKALKLHNDRKKYLNDRCLWDFFPDAWKEDCLGEISEEKWDELIYDAALNRDYTERLYRRGY